MRGRYLCHTRRFDICSDYPGASQHKTTLVLWIAYINSPRATVISGSTGDIAKLRTALTSRPTTLSVPYGFHSFQMDPMLDDYISLAGGVAYSVPKIPIASTLLASIVETSGVFNRLYLGQQIRQAVHFVGALSAVKDKLGDPV